MDLKILFKALGMVASITLPLFNLPLIMKIRRRGSSKDISLTWAIGVWACIVLMLPAALLSEDMVFRVFSLVNSVLFTGVVIYVLRYRHVNERKDGDERQG
jgi:uncharacterized protein with PQ loop repeat